VGLHGGVQEWLEGRGHPGEHLGGERGARIRDHAEAVGVEGGQDADAGHEVGAVDHGQPFLGLEGHRRQACSAYTSGVGRTAPPW
jgi:hypothetical protein